MTAIPYRSLKIRTMIISVRNWKLLCRCLANLVGTFVKLKQKSCVTDVPQIDWPNQKLKASTGTHANNTRETLSRTTEPVYTGTNLKTWQCHSDSHVSPMKSQGLSSMRGGNPRSVKWGQSGGSVKRFRLPSRIQTASIDLHQLIIPPIPFHWAPTHLHCFKAHDSRFRHPQLGWRTRRARF